MGDGDGAEWVVCIVENRAREVGLAYMDARCPTTVHLQQFSDTPSYAETVSAIARLPPAEVVMCRLPWVSQLEGTVSAELPAAAIVTVERRYFNETRGEAWIDKHAEPGASCREQGYSERYLALAAVAALGQYVEFSRRVAFATRALRVSFRGVEGSLVMDAATIRNLELVRNLRDGGRRGTLVAEIDRTLTPMGSRFLRVSLQQPSSDPATIETRLDCVYELLSSEATFFAVRGALRALRGANLAPALATLVAPPREPSLEAMRHAIECLLQLKAFLAGVPALATALAGARTELLRVAAGNCEHTAADKVSESIARVLDPDAAPARGALQVRIQQCYAVRGGVSGLLDVARATHSQSIEEIQRHVEEDLRAARGADWATLAYTARRGFHLSAPATAAVTEALDADPVFIQRARGPGGRRWVFTTEMLASLADRNAESEAEIILMTHRAVSSLAADIRGHIAALHRIGESVALVDLLASHATVVASNPDPDAAPFVRPALSEDGTWRVAGARHLVVERHLPAGSRFVANGADCGRGSRFQIVTGANNAGKSTYLRQMACVAILAHIGCPVPAARATVPRLDTILTRINATDLVCDDSSSFMLEMREAAHVLAAIDRADTSALVIIDELGRGTSTADGLGLAWAIAERIMRAPRATTFFATHFHQLNHLALAPGSVARCVHLVYRAHGVVPRSRNDPASGRNGRGGGIDGGGGGGIGDGSSSNSSSSSSSSITATTNDDAAIKEDPGPADHSVASGAMALRERSRHYGIETAAQFGFPAHVIAASRRYAAALHDARDALEDRAATTRSAAAALAAVAHSSRKGGGDGINSARDGQTRTKSIREIAGRLRALRDSSSLPDPELRRIVASLRAKVVSIGL